MAQWRLLTDAEIRALGPKHLASYMQWLKKYRAAQEQRITEKKAYLNKLLEGKQQREENAIQQNEQQHIAHLRHSLSRTT